MKEKFNLPDWFFFLLLFILSIAFFKLISSFIVDIFLAFILTQLFYKPTRWMHKKLKVSLPIASLISVIITILIIVIPAITVGILLSKETVNMYFVIKEQWPGMQNVFSVERINQLQQQYPFMDAFIDILKKLQVHQQLTHIFTALTDWIIIVLKRMFFDASLLFLHTLVTLIVTFFLLMDIDIFLKTIQRLSPLRDKDERELFSEFVKITDATLIGTVIIGIIEGTYGGLLFALFKIPSPIFWAVFMMFMSIVPIIGVHGIIFPVIVFLIATGHLVEGVALFFLAHAGTSLTQHYLKPTLIGKRSGLHPAIVLVSTLGGIAWLGILGFLIGPVIASLFVSIWNQYGRHYQAELKEWHAGNT
ncbi:MAG: AI-2E family transporter [Candidatus Margulisbacteria bacterium]|nr:AI-2E family transporter [Candidatus Margulisiibacteriota bacterium]